MKLLGWSFPGDPPQSKKFVLLGAPHTSNWDFFIAMSIAYKFNLKLRFLIKHTVFWFPLGNLISYLGGVPVNRSSKNNIVDQVTEAFRSEDNLVLGILPEGTRKKTKFWHTGFHRMAFAAEVPFYLARVCGPEKECRLGPEVYPTADIEHDIQVLHDLFADAQGVIPELRTPVQLRARPEDFQQKSS